MEPSELLMLSAVSVTFVAVAFFMIGALRKRLARRSATGAGDHQQLLRREDWHCAAALAGFAIVLLALSLWVEDSDIDERSGNVQGAVLLIMFVAALLVVAALFVRSGRVEKALLAGNHLTVPKK